MPAPPPPPPPPPPPQKQMQNTGNKNPASSGGGSDAGMGLLLESIRQGKPLKKTTVVNDRSSPFVATQSKPPQQKFGSTPEHRQNHLQGSGGGGGAPMGLGDLFAGGIPKLKPVNAKSNSNNTSSQNQTSKAQPPQPPPVSQKPNMTSDNGPPMLSERKPSFGKPSVAPKPPTLNSKPARPNPPPKLPTLYIPQQPQEDSQSEPATPPPGVNRTQSMRLTPSSAEAPAPDYRTIGRKHNPMQPPPPPRTSNGGMRSSRGGNALRPPSAKPPPPPTKAPPPHPPPPPPPLTQPPPPPPHRANNGMLDVNGVSQNGPPAPPTRNSSMRNTSAMVNVNVIQIQHNSNGGNGSRGVDLEERFRHLFLPIENLPPPEPFTGIIKTYPSKIAQSVKRQPAPQPPQQHQHTQIQLGGGNKLWLNNTSTC